MKTLRYSYIMIPLDRYVQRLTPAWKKLLSVLELGLLLLLLSLVVFFYSN